MAKLELHQGTAGNFASGLLIGTIAGSLFGVVVGQSSYNEDSMFNKEMVIMTSVTVLGVIGAIVGGVIGAVTHTDQWEPILLGSPEYELRLGASVTHRGASAVVALRF